MWVWCRKLGKLGRLDGYIDGSIFEGSSGWNWTPLISSCRLAEGVPCIIEPEVFKPLMPGMGRTINLRALSEFIV